MLLSKRRIVLPLLVALVAGGTVLEGYRVEGAVERIVKASQESENEITQAQVAVTKDADSAKSVVRDAKASIHDEVSNQIKKEVENQTAEFKTIFEDAEKSAVAGTQKQLSDFAASLSARKSDYEKQSADLFKSHKDDFVLIGG